MTTLAVSVVTPEASLWSGEATAFVARSREGDFTVLPQHTATVGNLVSGVVRVDTAEGEVAFAVHGGFFRVSAGAAEGVTLATVLASVAERTTDINVARAQVAKEQAEAALADARNEPDDATTRLLEGDLERAELRLRAAGQAA